MEEGKSVCSMVGMEGVRVAPPTSITSSTVVLLVEERVVRTRDAARSTSGWMRVTNSS